MAEKGRLIRRGKPFLRFGNKLSHRLLHFLEKSSTIKTYLQKRAGKRTANEKFFTKDLEKF